MRLWSLDPSYLDAKGLVAVWREGLLARKVLQGQTRGYRHHAQLVRFKAQAQPERAIECYLWGVYEESLRRGYHFDASKLGTNPGCAKIPVTFGQIQYELHLLKSKLRHRDLKQFQKLVSVQSPQTHPLFQVVPGEIETWERMKEIFVD